MMWDGGYMMGAGWFWMPVMLIAIALIVVGVILLIRGLGSSRQDDRQGVAPSAGPPPPGVRSSTALQVLEERYARGEIDRDEFLRRREDLTS
jgi:putative membrane protein